MTSKDIQEMGDMEFAEKFCGDRELVAQMMLGAEYSPFPDRPMHPNAKMSGNEGEPHPEGWSKGVELTKHYKHSNGCQYGMQSVTLKSDGSVHFIKSMMRG